METKLLKNMVRNIEITLVVVQMCDIIKCTQNTMPNDIGSVQKACFCGPVNSGITHKNNVISCHRSRRHVKVITGHLFHTQMVQKEKEQDTKFVMLKIITITYFYPQLFSVDKLTR